MVAVYRLGELRTLLKMHIFPKSKGATEMPSLVGLFSSISFLQYQLTLHLLYLSFSSYHICWGSYCNLSTTPCLCTLSPPSQRPAVSPVPCSPLIHCFTHPLADMWAKSIMLGLIQACWQASIKHSEKGLSFLCSALVAGAPHLQQALDFLTGLAGVCCLKDSPLPPSDFLESLQQFKTRSSVLQVPISLENP